MNHIPLSSKISLLNKYIQINNLKSHGDSKHDDYLMNDVLTSIAEDLKSLEEKPEKPEISLKPVIQNLKKIQESQSHPPVNLESVISDLQTFLESQSNPEFSLTGVIKNLEEMEEKENKSKSEARSFF